MQLRKNRYDKVMQKLYAVLDNVRSAHNVGAIFRTADGVGVAKIFLVGVTPQPIDRFGRLMPEIAKTSLGATETVAWEYCQSISECIQKLYELDAKIVAVEQDARSVAYTKHRPKGDVAYVFGNEIDGVSQEFLAVADAIVEIPMHGTKESLNVATTAGIVLFAARAIPS
ncbi:hypothetical protein A3C89_01780 [Candidatus Kaiserbacteria bacterium RIFCSPHIGHO2_02_FULL_50_50]|uniref:tRNA/rRNA methyltransferase SpoU type domain-containing protein n=1 Tax=Candidatus Kaiserbacteria bacterium RIFCSPHIGHO2_02_FULL_50_50 TaxID=1798492 RepID=A0A1F6DCS4_9BACT|nr:MAG: hypothetical protein A3C89_01780 [Candidatus Kaiserbacteria bacterium RIFCSPHIGHO2_02_FULL_50_50]OGG89001.1 MAG: hypothetical protein A3G62_04180 [Candidatus Kaiserbacteria bacterium RIFCSPLOWO2_12_FULL_50_10]